MFVVSCPPKQPHVLAQFPGRTGRLQRGVPHDDRISLPAAQRSEPTYTCLTSQKLTGRHDIIKLHYTDQEVHMNSPSAVVVDF